MSHSVMPKPAAAISPGNLLQIQVLHDFLLNHNLGVGAQHLLFPGYSDACSSLKTHSIFWASDHLNQNHLDL